MEESSLVLALHVSVGNSLCPGSMEITHLKLMADPASFLSDSEEANLITEGSGSISLELKGHEVVAIVDGGDAENLELKTLPENEGEPSIVSIDMEQLVEGSCLDANDGGGILAATKDFFVSDTAIIGVSGCLDATVNSIVTGVEIITGSSIGKLSASLVSISTDDLKVPPFADISIHEGIVSLRGRRSIFGLDYIPLWGFMSTCGRRPEMEDAVVVMPWFHEIPLSMLTGGEVVDDISINSSSFPGHFYGVYDGHGGAQVANYCKDRMHLALIEEIQNLNKNVTDIDWNNLQQKWECVFTNCFLKVDEEVSGGLSRSLDGSTSSAMETTGKKIPESPLRRSARTERIESSTNTNTKRHASPIMPKNRKADGDIGLSSNLRKADKIASGSATKRKVDYRGVSSSTDDSVVSASAQKKKRKVDVKNIDSDTKSEDSGKKTIRKLFHVRAYKNLMGSPGASSSKGKDSGNKGNKEGDVHNKRVQVAETIKPMDVKVLKKTEKLASSFDTDSPCDDVNKGNGTMFNGSKGRKRIPSDILLQSPGKNIHRHDQCAASVDSSLSIVEELGAGDSGINYDDCPEENNNIVPKECAIRSQIATDLIPNACLVCKQPGKLMCCFGKGCQRSYHLSCLEPLLPGAWLCKFCVKKKVEFGVYSVYDEIESVWDIDEGMQSGKHYYVKYKGLSHAHNRWIPESQLLRDAPSLLAKFRKAGQKEKATKWRKKWAEPERLLMRRLVEFLEASDMLTSGSVMESSNCCIEWFVKWKGLEYDQATWELENSPVLCSSEAARLMEDFDYRREQARRRSDPKNAEKALRVKKEPFCKLTALPDGCPSELGQDLLDSLNHLMEFWHRSVNTVLIDDQESFTKSILFVLALQCHACRPSLIITTSGYLPSWQTEFVRLAPSLNVVMYQGDKDVRKMIKNLEFYEESGGLMFQVLLADHDAIIEDFGDITCIGWEAVVIDKCEKSKISRHFKQLKSISTDFKLILFNGQLKDNLSEYHLLLSLVSAGGTEDDGLSGLKAEINEIPGALATVKEKLAHHIAYECKADSSTFLEYWVPVPFSNVQLEQYCATFISNSSVLRSNSKSDVVGALHNILITVRKCCDHPYLVDGELRGLLTKGLQGVDFLNAEVNASGKLFLLDKILQEMKSRELRVVILFQSLGGPGKISLGDILDDFLQLRFGMDSYERIESGLVRTKKLESLKMFNNKEGGRFVFMIEKRACVPSVKLRFVDAIILFDSDWNPVNDLRSLQKMSIESQDSCIKVFRLYTAFTVEEKLLMFSKQDTFLDSKIENLSRSITHSLLGWGASYLFRKLDQFHSSTRTTCISEPSFDKLCLNDVISEIISEMPGKFESTRTVAHSILLKVQQSGLTYSGNIVLEGEKEGVPFSDKNIPFFWPELLEGRYPRWIHISDHSQRNRRKVHNIDGFSKQNDVQSGEVKKKRPKSNIGVTVSSLESSYERRGSPIDARKSAIVDEGGEPKIEEQRNLLMLLKPELSKMCDILGLPASVKDKTQEFLLYIMSNHDVCSKQVTILQALKISLCWRAASMSRHRLDHAESLVLARKHLNFECTEEEAYSVYSRLRILKEKFPCQAAESDNLIAHNSLDNQLSCPRKTESEREPRSGRFKAAVDLDSPGLDMLGRLPDAFQPSKELVPPQKGHHGVPIKSRQNAVTSEDEVLKNQIDLIEKVYLRRSGDLAHKQQAEILLFEKQINEETVQMGIAHDLDLDFVRFAHIDLTVIDKKKELLTSEFSSKMVSFYQHLKQQKEKLVSMQQDMRNKEHELKQSWLLKVKTGQLEESFDNIPLFDTAFKLEKFKEAGKSFGKDNSSGTISLSSGHPSDEVNTELAKVPAGETNESVEYCHDVPTNILNGSVENIIFSDETWISQSVINDDVRPIEQSRSPVEQLASALPRNAVKEIHSEVLIQSSRETELVNASVMSSTIDIDKPERRDNSNGMHLVTSPGLNQEPPLISVQELANSVSVITSSDVREPFTNDRVRSDVDANSRNMQRLDCSHEDTTPGTTLLVSSPPHVELMCCNDETQLNFTSCQPDIADHEQSGLQPYCSSEQTEIPVYIAIVEPPIHQISENDVYLQRPQDLISERSSSEDLRGTGVLQEVTCAESLYSTQQTIVPGILSSNMEEPFDPQNTDNSGQILGDSPSERAPSENLRSIDLQTDLGIQLSHNLITAEWIPPQAVFVDPIQNEMLRIRKQDDLCSKKHEDSKLSLQLQREIELEKIRRKYDDLLLHAETEYIKKKNMFQEIYDKVLWHKVFAEEVRSKFYYDHKDVASTSFQGTNPIFSQQLHGSTTQPSFRPSSAPPPSTVSSHPATLTLNQESGAFLSSPRLRTRIPSLPSIPSSGSFSQASPIITNSTIRVPTTRASVQFGRAPAPHLQRFRPSTSVSTSNLTPTSSVSIPISTVGTDHLLESLFVNLPSISNELLASNIFDSRPNESPDIICLSDDE